MPEDQSVLARARVIARKTGVKPGAALHQARGESIRSYELDDRDRWAAHVGKRVQFVFGRQLLVGRLLRFDRYHLVVHIEYRIGVTTAEFRGTLKQLGKVGFLED